MAQQNRQFENSEQLYKSTSAKNAQVQTAVEYFDAVNKLANENQGNKAKKQTAVEWLMDKLFDPSTMVQEQIQWFQQAKAMEKEQIIKAFESQKNCVEKYYEYAEQYYTETYNK
jgi:hypothetical protein